MMHRKVLHSILLTGALIVLTPGCTQKLGQRVVVDPSMNLASSQITVALEDGEVRTFVTSGNPFKTGRSNRVGSMPRPLLILDGITHGAKLTAEGDYVWATGGGEGFGSFNINSGDFISGKSAVDPQQGGFNIFGTDVRSITALVRAGDYVFASGSKGLAQIDVSDPGAAEIYRLYPDPQQSDASPDLFKWNSAVHVPGTRRVFGFRGRQIFNLAFDAESPTVSQMNHDISCGEGAAYFNNKIYVAGCTQLLELSPQAEGQFQLRYFKYRLNAIDVFATRRLLYVQHQPVSGRAGVNARPGIYVFDASGNLVTWLNIQPLSFSVSEDDEYLFSNDIDQDVRVRRISSTNR